MKKSVLLGGILVLLGAQLVSAQVQTRAELYLEAEGQTSDSEGSAEGTARAEYRDTADDPATGSGTDSSAATDDPDQPIIIGDVPNPDTETKESGEKAGTEDINIGIGELQEDEDGGFTVTSHMDGEMEVRPSQTKVLIMAPSSEDDVQPIDAMIAERLDQSGIEHDDLSFVSRGTVYVHSGYMKIGDIKGESQQAPANNSNSNSNSNSNTNSDIKGGKGGNVEFEWKVEEGESAMKPREIVVVGSATDNDAETLSRCNREQDICEADRVRTDAELSEFLQRSVNEYDELEKTEVDAERIRLHTRQAARLFGIFPIKLRQEVEIGTDADTLGRVKVRFPWWSFLAKKSISAAELQVQVAGQVDAADYAIWRALPDTDESEGDIVPVDQVSLNFSQIVAVMHDTAMAIIRNHK